MPQPHLVLAIGMPSGFEWIIVLVIMLLIFGGNKLPGVMRSLGGSVREFKKGMEGEDPSKPLPPPAQIQPVQPPAAPTQPTTPTQDHGSAKT